MKMSLNEESESRGDNLIILQVGVDKDDLIEPLFGFPNDDLIDFILALDLRKGDWGFTIRLLERFFEEVIIPGRKDFGDCRGSSKEAFDYEFGQIRDLLKKALETYEQDLTED